jgi:isoamylase
MSSSVSAASARIFISYRREETAAYVATWLYDRLSDRFGKGQVFKDIDDIRLGEDFVARITDAVGSCRVLLALIGDRWLTVADKEGRRRLDRSEDWVRLEIETALRRNISVIPILVGAARMPRADELPANLAGLVRRQALELSPIHFNSDVDRLLKDLDEALTEVLPSPIVAPYPIIEIERPKIVPRDESRLGATYDGKGTDFSLFSSATERVEVCLLEENGREERIDLPERRASTWGGYIEGVHPGQLYGYRVYGAFDPKKGFRFNSSKLLIDPYARAICGKVEWGEEIFAHDIYDENRINTHDSKNFMPKSVVIDPHFDWSGDVRLNIPLSDSLIYEAHVKGLTIGHPEIPLAIRGTYAGLAHPAMIDHYKRIGVTAIQLMPVHHFEQEGLLLERGLSNYWGYNTIGFFAPHGAYASSGDHGQQVTEFKEMIKALHLAGVEVILDVVYNHTAEGDQRGPTLSFRGIDNAAYYRLEPKPFYYTDFTGTGNTLNVRNAYALRLIMDSLRYWVEEMHVDGFRFDLCSALAREGTDPERRSEFDKEAAFFRLIQQDPVLNDVKLIAEPWDASNFGYQVGNFPAQWSELNGEFRDCVRDFWRGTGRREVFADRISGSPDLYKASRRRPYASVNFVTSHDGFTLTDLVSYERKHNDANGNDNQDGTDDNRSWNCGVEGPADDPGICATRRRQRKNLLVSLMLSQGIPLLLAGDELGRTQQGNNNAYCQDNYLSWVDWSELSTGQDLTQFIARLTRLRRDHPVFRSRRYALRRPMIGSGGVADLAWLTSSGDVIHQWTEAQEPLGIFLNGRGIRREDGRRLTGDSFIIYLNPHREEQEVRLPKAAYGKSWEVLIDTTSEDPAEESSVTYTSGSAFRMGANSSLVLRSLA